MIRRSLEDSWSALDAPGLSMPRDSQGKPFVPARMPRYDDEEPLGFSYFRCGLMDANLSNFTLPRTFFGRSSLERVLFCNTDLSESRMCWNDFIECDFSGADLTGCDMRASIFKDCNFAGAILKCTELRSADFQKCNFTQAQMNGARLTRLQGVSLTLSEEQTQNIDWHWSAAEEPGGG